jgi:hypothetical protein
MPDKKHHPWQPQTQTLLPDPSTCRALSDSSLQGTGNPHSGVPSAAEIFHLAAHTFHNERHASGLLLAHALNYDTLPGKSGDAPDQRLPGLSCNTAPDQRMPGLSCKTAPDQRMPGLSCTTLSGVMGSGHPEHRDCPNSAAEYTQGKHVNHNNIGHAFMRDCSTGYGAENRLASTVQGRGSCNHAAAARHRNLDASESGAHPRTRCTALVVPTVHGGQCSCSKTVATDAGGGCRGTGNEEHHSTFLSNVQNSDDTLEVAEDSINNGNFVVDDAGRRLQGEGGGKGTGVAAVDAASDAGLAASDCQRCCFMNKECSSAKVKRSSSCGSGRRRLGASIPGDGRGLGTERAASDPCAAVAKQQPLATKGF